MTFNEAYNKYTKLIVYLAYKEYNSKYHVDSSVKPEDVVQYGLIKLIECCLDMQPKAASSS